MKSSQISEVINSLQTPLLLINKCDWTIIFVNHAATKWMAAKIGENVNDYLNNLDISRIESRISTGKFKHNQDVIFHPYFNAGYVFSNFSDEHILIEGVDQSSLLESKAMIDSYAKIIEKKNKELDVQKKQSDQLLSNILPQKTINELKSTGKSDPQRYNQLSILFLDFIDFTKISSKLDAQTIFSELNDLFSNFDEIIYNNDCERIKTIGDAYMAASGFDQEILKGIDSLASCSLMFRDYVINRNKNSEQKWEFRVGIHIGPAIAGVIGKRKYIYDIFGDGVNTASRMESESESMKINVSEDAYLLLKSKYHFTPRPEKYIKGKGSMKMYFLDGKL